MGLFDILKKDKSCFKYIGKVPQDMKAEIESVNSATPEIFNINGKDGKEIAAEINNIVDNILKTNTFPEEYNSINDVAVALGIYYGSAICEYYNWDWKILGSSAEDSIISIVSPKENYSIQPMNYMLRILTNNNIGLDGNNDNTVLLLFNMLNNIDDTPKEKKYMPLS